MATTTILTDEAHTKRGVREGWDIDVHAAPTEDLNETIIHARITPPQGSPITVLREIVPHAQAEEGVSQGWAIALREIDARRAP
jgi:hypothetical protein